jgi:transposase
MLCLKQQEVANIYGVSHRAVLKWIKKWSQDEKEKLVSRSSMVRAVKPQIW